jgi:gas vesicle protein
LVRSCNGTERNQLIHFFKEKIMAFEQLAQHLADAESQQAELDAAQSSLSTARENLLAIQTQVAALQDAVNAAQLTVNSEKSDVVGALTALINRASEILAGLQAQ